MPGWFLLAVVSQSGMQRRQNGKIHSMPCMSQHLDACVDQTYDVDPTCPVNASPKRSALLMCSVQISELDHVSALRPEFRYLAQD